MHRRQTTSLLHEHNAMSTESSINKSDHTLNPLHDEQNSSNEYSSAFAESMKMAQANRHSHGYDNNTSSSRISNERIGWKTKLIAFSLFGIGLILVLTGAGIYYSRPSPSSSSPDRKSGLDMFIIGWIMLVPGSWACYQVVGNWLGWRYANLPSFD